MESSGQSGHWPKFRIADEGYLDAGDLDESRRLGEESAFGATAMRCLCMAKLLP